MDLAPPISDSTSIWIPTPTDEPSKGHDGPVDGQGLKEYHFAFLAIAIVLTAIVVLLLVKRTRKRARNISGHERGVSLWNNRRHQVPRPSSDQIREEGLNENGEAPPPYAPRSSIGLAGDSSANQGLPMPMQTSSRNEVGLKPPEYAQVHVRRAQSHPSAAWHASEPLNNEARS